MGFFSEVDICMQEGMTKEQAIKYTAAIKYGTPEEKKKALAMAEADIKLNTLK